MTPILYLTIGDGAGLCIHMQARIFLQLRIRQTLFSIPYPSEALVSRRLTARFWSYFGATFPKGSYFKFIMVGTL